MSNTDETKPKPPLSAYNLFFQLARKRILDGTDHMNLPITLPELAELAAQHKRKGKRVHRKTHGKISFRDLARAVSSKWKALSAEDRAIINHQVQLEKIEHAKVLQAWRKLQEEKETIQPKTPFCDLNIRPASVGAGAATVTTTTKQEGCNSAYPTLSTLQVFLESLGRQDIVTSAGYDSGGQQLHELSRLLEPTPLREGIQHQIPPAGGASMGQSSLGVLYPMANSQNTPRANETPLSHPTAKPTTSPVSSGPWSSGLPFAMNGPNGDGETEVEDEQLGHSFLQQGANFAPLEVARDIEAPTDCVNSVCSSSTLEEMFFSGSE